MQISAQTLLASQQPPLAKAPPGPATAFAATLEKSDGFAPLPLRQVAAAPEAPVAAKAPGPIARPGAMIDIRI
ncbi:MAG: hypothetical protein J0H61_12515 [Alphaproteobacteria bacterium]|nr:hypothetical protein [Alphaproteobacteria bacterium]